MGDVTYLNEYECVKNNNFLENLFFERYEKLCYIMRKKEVLQSVLQFNLSCRGHLQLTVFIHRGC